MDYEKKYKEALGWMKSVYPTMTGAVKEDAEHYFPELKESEDERIRKGIIRNLEYLMDRAEGFVKNELKERIAWLKKQGEHTEWSEEDKKMIINICKNLYDYPRVNSPFDNNSFKEAQKQVDWFKSRVQPRQE